MTTNSRAAKALSAFLFAQGLLGFAAVAAVVLHHAPAETVMAAAVPAQTTVR